MSSDLAKEKAAFLRPLYSPIVKFRNCCWQWNCSPLDYNTGSSTRGRIETFLMFEGTQTFILWRAFSHFYSTCVALRCVTQVQSEARCYCYYGALCGLPVFSSQANTDLSGSVSGGLSCRARSFGIDPPPKTQEILRRQTLLARDVLGVHYNPLLPPPRFNGEHFRQCCSTVSPIAASEMSLKGSVAFWEHMWRSEWPDEKALNVFFLLGGRHD